MKPYRAITRWNGHEWWTGVEDPDGHHVAESTAAHLAQVADNARQRLEQAERHVYQQLGKHRFGDPADAELHVDVHLPGPIESDLHAAESHVADATKETDAVVAALRHANMSGHDIAALLTQRSLQHLPQRPLLIPNREIASHGLTNRHDVIAVEWTDGNDTLTCCRTCVEKNRRPWRKRRDATSAAVYDSRVLCDVCGQKIAARESVDPPSDEAIQ
jgi:hypothetical protein